MTPWRARRVWTFTTVRSSSSSQDRIFSAWGSRLRQAGPWPSVRWGRTFSTTRLMKTSLSWSSPLSRSRPVSTAAST